MGGTLEVLAMVRLCHELLASDPPRNRIEATYGLPFYVTLYVTVYVVTVLARPRLGRRG